MRTTEWTTIVAALCLSARKNEEKLSQSYFSNGITVVCCRCLPMFATISWTEQHTYHNYTIMMSRKYTELSSHRFTLQSMYKCEYSFPFAVYFISFDASRMGRCFIQYVLKWLNIARALSTERVAEAAKKIIMNNVSSHFETCYIIEKRM